MTDESKVLYLSEANLLWIGRGGVLCDEHDYLFLSKKGQEPFIEFMKKQHELNDFCVTLTESLRVRRLADLSFLERNSDELTEEQRDDLIHEFVFGYDVTKIGVFFAPAATLVLLYASLILGLKSIARWYGEEQHDKWYKKSKDPAQQKKPEYRELVKLLREISHDPLEIFEAPQVKIVLETHTRKIRNDFMHGDWEAVEQHLKGMNIRTCFGVVSKIFSALEDVFDEDADLFKERFKTRIVF